ncbi:MAG: biopolymer transporter ExbD [Prevotella sp.]|nr:biopolymer transporter ExbD [Prevotella sp.]MBQ8702533.1 biopolymer transporter ExbD [Prevotella sp.]
MFKRSSHTVPSLNTTSTADISFMLLIFFLVTTSMDVDKGITRLLPPMDDKEKQELRDIERSNILSIELMDDGTVEVDGEKIMAKELRQRVKTFVSGADREKHLISITTSPKASYQRYFTMQNEIVAAYRELNEKAKEPYPLRIAENVED